MPLISTTKDGDPLKISHTLITPDLAAAWLAHNTRNRRLREATVGNWAEDMSQGDWLNDTDPVRFHGFLNDRKTDTRKCPEGCETHPVLLNGQTRLTAITHSGEPQKLIIVEGLRMIDQSEMDTGSKRKLEDQLKLQGHGNTNVLAATIRLAYLHQHGRVRSRSYTPSFSALLRWFDEHHDEVKAALPLAQRVYREIGGRVSVYGAAQLALARVEDPTGTLAEDTDTWWHQLLTGENLTAGAPALRYRKITLALKAKNFYEVRRPLDQVDLLAMLFKAWNAYRAGEKVMQLKYRKGGANPEPFPIPH